MPKFFKYKKKQKISNKKATRDGLLWYYII